MRDIELTDFLFQPRGSKITHMNHMNAWEHDLSRIRNSCTKNFSSLPFTRIDWINSHQLYFLQQTNLLIKQVEKKHQLINQYIFWLSSEKRYQESTLIQNKVATPEYFNSYGQWLVDYPPQFALHLTAFNRLSNVIILSASMDVYWVATLVVNLERKLTSKFLILLVIAFLRQLIILMKRLKTKHLKALQKITGGTAWTFACLTKPLVLVIKNAAWEIRYAFLSAPLSPALSLKAQNLV